MSARQLKALLMLLLLVEHQNFYSVDTETLAPLSSQPLDGNKKFKAVVHYEKEIE